MAVRLSIRTVVVVMVALGLALAARGAVKSDTTTAPGPKLVGWSYQTDARPLGPKWKDPGNRLTDGKTGRGNVAIWRGSSVRFTLDLQGPCQVRGVRIALQRHNLNYKLDHLAVSVRQAGTWRPVARRAGFIGPTPTMDFMFTLAFPTVRTDMLRLDFVGCTVLSLSEIEVFGERVKPAQKAVGLYATIPFRSAVGPMAREQDLDGDGVAEVVLENRFVRLVFTPAHGGVCRSLRFKPANTEFVCSGQTGYGLFRDQFWKPKAALADRLYFHRIANSADAGSVELWATGTGGMMGFTEVRKRIALAKDSPVIRVRYVLTNQPSSQTDYEYGLWFHNWLGKPGAVNTYFYPTTDGVQTLTVNPTSVRKGRDVWHRSPARGWTAVRSDDGSGLAVELPYKYLNLLYSWYGVGSPAATLEWRFNRIRVPAGGRLEAGFSLIPFHGLERVDGVVGDVVGAIDASAGPGRRLKIAVQLLNPTGAAPGTAHVVLRTQKTGKTKPLGTVTLSPGNIAQFAAEVSVAGPGAYAAVVTVEKGNKAVGSFERPVFIGGTHFAYRLEPEGKQVGKKEETATAGELPEHEISTTVVTPHVPWAVPFAGGRLRALVLMDDMNSREAVELAERIDLDLDTVKFRTTLATEYLYQGDRSILTLDAAQKRLLRHLKTRRYDVMIFAGFKWDFHFTPEIRKAILDKVRNGTGLVLIQPDGFTPEMAAELPGAGIAKTGNAGRRTSAWFPWNPLGNNPLVRGLDWSRFPVTRRHEYSTPPRGQVIATIGKDNAPLLVLSSLGKGRVVSATWDTLTHQLSYRGYSALTPILSYRGGWLRPEFSKLPSGYQEWWFALLTRLTAWAAGRDTGAAILEAPAVTVDLANVGPGAAAVRLTVKSIKSLSGGTVETVWFNAVGDRFAVTRQSVALPAGTGQVAVPVPAGVTFGANSACFILRNAGGAALAWGFTTVHGKVPVWIGDLTVTPDTLLPEGGIWQTDGPVETRTFVPDRAVQARIRLSAPAPAALEVVWTLRDTFGRVLCRAHDTIAAGGAEAARAFGPFPLVAQGIECMVHLQTETGALWDARHVRAIAYRPRVWDRFWFTSWGGQYLWRSKYLFDFNNRLVRDFGVDVSFWGDTELNTGKVRDNAYWGINHSWLGLLQYLGRGVPDFGDHGFARKAAQYAKTHDVKCLVRNPCLVDPEWREAVRRKLIERVRSTLNEGGAVDYCMGDEMSLTYYTRFFDFDWSEQSRADFRRYLQQKYDSIQRLNAAWGAKFATWKDVAPMTREQARTAKTPAPWFEFRLYMNRQLADFFAFVQQTIRGVDPHARCGLSGTQSPEAANGMDWWLISQGFSYFHSYNTNWSCEMRRSFQAYGGADQSPYFAGYSATDPGAENRMWWCLFHDTRGISAWKTGLFFYGDFSETRSGTDTRRHLDSFRRGIWRLLRHAKRQQDGIAIYFSMPSITAGALDGDERRINGARDAWVKILEDSGLQYEFVAGPQVAEGILRKGLFKVVVLPYTVALPDAEVRELKEFVRNGGALIATQMPAVRDGLGRPRRPGALADTFGARLDGSNRAVGPGVHLTAPFAGLPAGTELRLPPLSSALQVHGGKSLAKGKAGETVVAALVLGSKGRALLLNLDLGQYEQERRSHSPSERGLRRIVGAFLAGVGVQPRYPVHLKSGRPSHVEVVRYVDGDLEYLCLLNGDADPVVATIPLAEKRLVYDARAEQFRGEMQELQVPLTPLCARVFCLAPRRLPEPRLRAPQSAVRAVRDDAGAGCGGRIPFSVRLEKEAPGPQLVRVTVRDTKRREHRELMQTIWVGTTPVASFLPLAVDDATGEWTLTAAVVGTGRTVVAQVDVRP